MGPPRFCGTGTLSPIHAQERRANGALACALCRDLVAESHSTRGRCLRMSMKNWLLFGAAILGILAVAILYSTLHGYTTWYWKDTRAQLLVDGNRVSGYVHASRQVLIVTRRDTPKPHSYFIALGSKRVLLDCGDWSAPRFFVFPIGHVNPPCLMALGDETAHNSPYAPDGPLKITGTTLEFHTKDGKRIAVNR